MAQSPKKRANDGSEKESEFIAWEKAKIASNIFAICALPIIIAYVGNSISSQLTNRELDIRTMELAIDILKTDPTENEQPGIRTWAVEILEQSSGIGFSREAKREVLSKPLKTQNIEQIDPKVNFLHLHDEFASRVTELLDYLNKGGYTFVVKKAYVSPREQFSLAQRGLSHIIDAYTCREAEKGVTWSSKHNFGLSVDLIAFIDGKVTWDWSAYEPLGPAAEQFNLYWGGEARNRSEASKAGGDAIVVDGTEISMPNADVSDLYSGVYPGGFTERWKNFIADEIEKYSIGDCGPRPPTSG